MVNWKQLAHGKILNIIFSKRHLLKEIISLTIGSTYQMLDKIEQYLEIRDFY